MNLLVDEKDLRGLEEAMEKMLELYASDKSIHITLHGGWLTDWADTIHTLLDSARRVEVDEAMVRRAVDADYAKLQSLGQNYTAAIGMKAAEENISRLKQGQPISFDGVQVGVADKRILIMYGETEISILHELQEATSAQAHTLS